MINMIDMPVYTNFMEEMRQRHKATQAACTHHRARDKCPDCGKVIRKPANAGK